MIRPMDTFRRWWQNGAAPAAQIPSTGNGHDIQKPARPWLGQLDRAGIPRSLVYPATTLGRILDQSADRFGDAPAIAYGSIRWNYRELLAQVNRTAGGLSSLGVRRGDRVLFTLPNCPEFVTAFLAVQKLGAVVVNAGPLMGADDLNTVIGMTTPRVALGLDLQANSLTHAAGASTIEHWVWVSLQSYQTVLKRLGYQYQLWHHRNGNGRHAEHIGLTDLLAQAPARPPTLEPDADKPAVLQATGGTTGTLKLAQLTHRGLLANALQVTAVMSCRQGQERFMAALPMFHVYGLTTCMIVPVFTASQMILMTRFNAADALDLVRRERATVLPVVPAMCTAVCDELDRQEKRQQHPAPRLDAVRLCFSGAAPLPSEVAQRFLQKTGAAVVEGYGLTEASPVTHLNPTGNARMGSIGLPIPDTDARVVRIEPENEQSPVNGNGQLSASPVLIDVAPGECGEMLISGPQVMLGYFANPKQTQQSLVTDEHGKVWLRTGDVVRMDEEGYFYVIDRKKDMIIRSGLKIFPAKVEQCLKRHPRVTDVAIVGRPDPVHTEIVVAVVVLKPLSDKAENAIRAEDLAADQKQIADELRALCREHLARYEVPAEFQFVSQLPRSGLGKLLKRELRKQLADGTLAPVPLEDSPAAPASNGNGSQHASNHNGKTIAGGKPAAQQEQEEVA